MRRLIPLMALAAILLAGIWLSSRLLESDGASANRADATVEGAGAPELSVTRPDSLVEAAPEESTGRSAAAAPSVAAPGRARTGAVIVLTRTPDGGVVPNVRVVLDPRKQAPYGAGIELFETDETGRARVDGLAPGTVTVWSPRGARKRGEVVAGQEIELVLEFEDCVDVTGVVVDADGTPVAGADVWICGWRHDWLATQRISRTGADGSFAIESVDKEKSLGASAAGHGPSELVDLELTDVSASPVVLELVLGAGGGGLRGRVLTHTGRPVAGARVAVGGTVDDYSMRGDGTHRETWGARVSVTDADGSYELVGLVAGSHPVAVSAANHPELDAEVEISAGVTSTLDLTLEQGMRVVGVVRDANGGPVERAVVIALDEPFEDPFPTQGPTDTGAPFHRPATRTAADGSFALENLVPGELHLYAAKGTTYWDSRGDEFLGTAQATLEGKAGETLDWQPVIQRGGEIRGRVTYADGTVLGNVFVSAIDPEDERRRWTTHSGKDGRFVIPGLETKPYKVYVQLWDAPDDAPPLERPDVWPSESEIVLVASYSKSTEERTRITLRVADDAGRLEGSGAVRLAHDRGAYHAREEDGVFSAKLPPGRYQPRVMSGDAVVGYGDWFDVVAGEERDLGTVHTSPCGRLVVRLQRDADLPSGVLWTRVNCAGIDQGYQEVAAGASEITFDDLLAGPSKLTIQGGGVANVLRELVIEDGTTRELDVRLQRAAKCKLVFGGNPTNGWGRIDLTVRDENGALCREWTHRERWSGALPVEHSLAVPCGRFTVHATTSDGRSAEGEVVVESLDEPVTATFSLD